MTAPKPRSFGSDLFLAGLCSTCMHRRVVESARGSVFVMCGLAKTLPDFEKYPRLPVLQCRGHEPASVDDD